MSAEITIHMRRRVLSGKPELTVPLLAICGVSIRTSIDVATYPMCASEH